MGAFSVTVAYRDGRASWNKKNYPAGIFATNFLNVFYKNVTAARISVFSDEINYNILKQLRCGYLNIRNFTDTGRMILEELKALPNIPVYSILDFDTIRERVAYLFSEKTGQRICEYFVRRAEIGLIPQNEVIVDTAYRRCDFEYINECEDIINELTGIITFFNNISDDMYCAHKNLVAFVNSLPDIEKHDEGHLLPVAKQIFGDKTFSVNEEFVEVRKNIKSQFTAVARKLYFDSFYSFIVTDFFEGLHYGHYPKRCEVCGKYFLMQSARKQKYCTNGIAPEKINGQKLTCRQYAAAIRKKELSENNPIMDIYNKRCSCIRTEALRGTITADFAEKAKVIAKNRMLLAKRNPEYFKTQYKKDLSRKKLYADAEKN